MDQAQHSGAPGIANADPATKARREEYYKRLSPNSMAPLWEVLGDVVTPEPRVTSKPYIWKWAQTRPLLMEAGKLVTAEEAERRVLVLENPAYPGESRATNTLYAGVQIVMPGEIAPAHRHTQAALRFVLESKGGGYTAVGGEKTTMYPGDFVITPSWTFHDHGNSSDAPIIWMDVLDVPMLALFEGGFAEQYNAKSQVLARPEGDALARFGSGLVPIDASRPYGEYNSPIFNYPFSRTREALIAAAKGSLDPHWGATLPYVNPLNGGWAMSTIASWMMYLPAGTVTKRMRSTDGMICAVAEGAGSVWAGDVRMDYGAKDSFVIPNWTWRHFKAETDSFIFFSSDRGVQERMDIWREERAN